MCGGIAFKQHDSVGTLPSNQHHDGQQGDHVGMSLHQPLVNDCIQTHDK